MSINKYDIAKEWKRGVVKRINYSSLDNCPPAVEAGWSWAHRNIADKLLDGLNDYLASIGEEKMATIHPAKCEMSDEKAANLFVALTEMTIAKDRAGALSDTELADALLNIVWSALDMRGYPSALIEEAIDRLKARCCSSPGPTEKTDDG